MINPLHIGPVYRTGSEPGSRKIIFPPSQFAMGYVILATKGQLKDLVLSEADNPESGKRYFNLIRMGAKENSSYNTYNVIDKAGCYGANVSLLNTSITAKIKTRSRGNCRSVHIRNGFLTDEGEPNPEMILSCDCRAHSHKKGGYDIACAHINAALIHTAYNLAMNKQDFGNINEKQVFIPYNNEPESRKKGILTLLKNYFIDNSKLYETDLELMNTVGLSPEACKWFDKKLTHGSVTMEVLPNDETKLSRDAAYLEQCLLDAGLAKDAAVKEWNGDIVWSYTDGCGVDIRLMSERNPPELLVSVPEPARKKLK